MRFERLCPICKKAFITNNLNRKACSPECSKESRRRYRVAWLERHPDYMSNYFVENRERYSRKARKERKEEREKQCRA